MLFSTWVAVDKSINHLLQALVCRLIAEGFPPLGKIDKTIRPQRFRRQFNALEKHRGKYSVGSFDTKKWGRFVLFVRFNEMKEVEHFALGEIYAAKDCINPFGKYLLGHSQRSADMRLIMPL